MVRTDAHYVGGFIGDNDSKRDLIKFCTSIWEQNIHTIIKMVGKYPQEIYDVVVRVIKLESIFLQRLTRNKAYVLASVEKLLQEAIFPHPFFGKSKSLTPLVCTLSNIPVKKAVLGLHDTMTPTDENS